MSNTPNWVDLSEVLDQMPLCHNNSRSVQIITWTILILKMWQQTWIDSSQALFCCACNMTFHIVVGPRSTREIVMVFLIKWLGAGSRQYCRYTKSPGYTPLLKEIWESPRATGQRKFGPGGVWTQDLQIRSSDALQGHLFVFRSFFESPLGNTPPFGWSLPYKPMSGVPPGT